MATVIDAAMREQLFDRRRKLETVIDESEASVQFRRLLEEVDAALARMDEGTYGVCEVCRDHVEPERLMADPLTCVCLGCLTPAQKRALEEDIELAVRIQAGLLPRHGLALDGWQVSYHYEAAAHISGDYLDIVAGEDEALYFMLGDVAGKGIASSLLMSQLHAMFRTLIPLGLPLAQQVERASRIFCESTLPTHYATLVVGRAGRDGRVEVCNAGHLPPILIHEGGATLIEATGLPVGIFCNEQFTSSELRMEPGDTLFLFTDGLSESRDEWGAEYSAERLRELLCRHHDLAPDALIGSVCATFQPSTTGRLSSTT